MSKTQDHYIKMTETPVAKLIVTLGIPTTISMLITSIYNMADTYFVGGLGESAQGATGILFTLQAIIQAIAFMMGHGSGTFVAKALADRDVKDATRYVSTAFFFGTGLGLILMSAGLILLRPFMLLLGSTETILPHAMDYGMWVLLSCPLLIGSLVLNNNLRYEGKAFYAMFGLTSGGLLNILLDYIFVRVVPLGVFGAGMATAISQAVSFTILLVMYQTKAQSRISFRAIARESAVILSIMRVGFPSLLRQGLTSISHGILNNLTKPFGDAAIAAISVVNRCSSFVLCVGLGIGQGFQPVASFNYQIGKRRRVKQGLLFTMGLGLVLSTVLSVLFLIFSPGIISLFQKSAAVIAIGTKGLRFAAIGLLFLPLAVPVNMLYQSIREAGVASFLALMRSGLAFIPVLLLLGTLLGLDGILLSQPIADVISGLVAIPFMISFLRRPDDPTAEK
ncbi:MAG: MATE family efflux transporter [Clostridia bacterium]|nr:MATE family efflux transporter [Clostridia bacterium]